MPERTAGMPDDGAPRAVVRVADAVVVGGGMAGLVAAATLTRGGRDVVVLEAADVVGGPLRAVAMPAPDGGELLLDAGAESFATRSDAVTSLAHELGLETDEPAAGGAWAWAGGRAYALPAPALLGIPGRPGSAAVRAAVGLGGQARALLDGVLPRRVGADSDTLAALVRARMGRQVLSRLVGPVAGGVHAADPADLAVDAVAPGLRSALGRTGSLAAAVLALRGGGSAPGSAVRGVVGGMHRLPAALAARAGEIRTGARVRDVVRDGDAWLVGTADGDAYRARDVVVATDAATAARLLAPLVHASPADFSAVAPDHAADITLVTLLLRTDALTAAPRGTGVLVASDGPSHGVRAKALTHVDAKWAWVRRRLGAGHAVVRLSYGRPGERLEAPPGSAFDAWLKDVALADAGTLLGVRLAASDVAGSALTRWPGALPPPTPAARAARDRLIDAASALDGVAVTGAWVAGTGLAQVVPHAADRAEELLTRNA